MTKNITPAEWQQQVLKAEQPVLIDFWAPWCGPCRTLAPVIENIASQYEGQAQVYKLNADEHPEMLQKYRVMSIPTLIYFAHGTPVHRTVGFQPEQAISARMEKVIALSPDEAQKQTARPPMPMLTKLMLGLISILLLDTLLRWFF